MLSERDGGRDGRDGRLPGDGKDGRLPGDGRDGKLPEDDSFPDLVGGVPPIGLDGLILIADVDTDRCRASPLAPLKEEGCAPGGVIGPETSTGGGIDGV